MRLTRTHLSKLAHHLPRSGDKFKRVLTRSGGVLFFLRQVRSFADPIIPSVGFRAYGHF